MEKILVVFPTEESHRELLTASAPEAEFTFADPDTVSRETVQGADIILGNLSPELIKGTRKLKWVQLNSAGTDGYTSPGVLPEGAVLTNATGAYGLAISEHMLGALLSLMKKLHLYEKDQLQHRWTDHGAVTSIWNSNTLIVGFGNIGSEFAVRMHALGSRVTGIRRNQTEKPDYLEELYRMDRLDECLAKADIVAACLPETKETSRLFDEKRFAKMKKGSFFLNVGRGSAVDTLALADALNTGHLAGAFVDVTDPEPLPSGHPLWDAENVLITPHVSGGYHLKETHDRIVRIAAENLRKWQAGEQLDNIVDFTTGYRKLI